MYRGCFFALKSSPHPATTLWRKADTKTKLVVNNRSTDYRLLITGLPITDFFVFFDNE